MKLMSDYPKSIAPNDRTAYGTFRDETQPGAGDGTDIKAAQMQDLYYALYQVLSLAGTTPNNDLENSIDNRQFLNSLAQVSWLKYDSSLSYSKNAVVFNTVNDITRLYRSQQDNNTAPLDDADSWYNILTIDANNIINLNSVASNGIFIGSLLYGIRKDAPVGFLRCDGSEYSRSQYPQFYDEFLLTGRILAKSYAEYVEEAEANAMPITIPRFTSNSEQGFIVSDAVQHTNCYAIFNGVSYYPIGVAWRNYWLQLQYPQPGNLFSYTIRSDSHGDTEYPSAWEVYGSNDGEHFTLLDSRTGQAFGSGATKQFNLTVTESTPDYSYYRIQLLSGIGVGGELGRVTMDVRTKGDVGYFGINKETQTFRVPKIQTDTFLIPAAEMISPIHIRYPFFVCITNSMTSEVSKEDITQEIVQAGDTQKERLETIAGTQLYLPGTLIHSSCILHQAGLYPANGDLLASDGIYTDFYNYILEHQGDFRLITEEVYQQELALSGQCGGYVLDTEDKTLRIPTITKFVEGTVNLDELGTALRAGLPNITGEVTVGVVNANYFSGAFQVAKSNLSSASGLANYGRTASFDAARCNPIYGQSETVQPEAIRYPIYIVVGNVTKTELLTNLDNLANDLALRTNIDGSNALFNHLSDTAIDNLAKTLFPDFTTEISRSWNTVYFTNQAVYLIGEVKTEASSIGAVEVSRDQTTWHKLWLGENWNTVSSASFNLVIPRNYYYRGINGSKQTLFEYQLCRHQAN